jgi:hypothetical protein
MNFKNLTIAALMFVSVAATAATATQPTRVQRGETSTEYHYPVGVDSTPLVVVVPDTTIPLQQIIIRNQAPPPAPPVKITGALDGAVLPLGVKNAGEAMIAWPFAALLEKANKVFLAPETIKLEKSSEISLVIDLSKDVDKIKAELEGVGKLGEKIQINRVVVAKLLAPDFEVIEVIKDGRQLLDLKGPTEWRWTVTPRKLGEYKVNVVVTAVIEIGNDRAERLIQVFDQEVTVFVTPGDAAKFFFTKNWQWLWSTLVLPLGLWYWKNRRNKKNGLIANEE